MVVWIMASNLFPFLFKNSNFKSHSKHRRKAIRKVNPLSKTDFELNFYRDTWNGSTDNGLLLRGVLFPSASVMERYAL